MSRIREALKKAAEEREIHTVGPAAEGFLDALGEPSKTSSAAELVRVPEHRGPLAEQVGHSEFDKLASECRQVRWNFEPRYSAFSKEVKLRGGAERFRTLRSRLYQIASTQPLRRVLLTSSAPQEGKTFVASNLAQSIIRQENRKVLLVDADLRASRLHLTLGADSEPGLSDYLSGQAELKEVMQASPERNLCFIPGGLDIPNPSELLHSEKMNRLLDDMSKIFDWVIVDSPPALAVHDASILADMCDGVLFVVRAGVTDFEVAQKAAAEFQDKKLLGVVLNRADKKDNYGDYYYAYPYAGDEPD